ncbi:L-2-hydroxyglutarate oxidase, partial [Alteromonas sp. AMM-1]|uniref:L-2-hydroxyglutarate oxidase n=1 Tax=Alteromonas sp. AMM-1 TaxID=3394233 RepID=UPI0039A55BEB
MSAYDFVIIGAGIIGAAVAHELSLRKPGCRVLLLDKAERAASHQTGRNSGVIHAGVYYAPGSLKATFCRQGLEDTLAFCKQHQLPFEQCGKLLVATDNRELEAMQSLFERCEHNDLQPDMLSAAQIRQKEPNIRAVGGFLVKQTGITDYQAITCCLLSLAAKHARLDVRYQHQVTSVQELGDCVQVCAETSAGKASFQADFLINCAGIYSDEIIKSQGLACDFRMLPFRGEYFRLVDKYNAVSSHLIYPIPDPNMPFL